MYANGIAPEVGDVGGDPSCIGDVLEVTPNETGVCVVVQWRDAETLRSQPIPAKSLTFVRRK
jgi:hypothetical protein